MNVIHIEEEAFYTLIAEVVARIRAEHKAPVDRWIDGVEAMQMLRINSPTTLQKFRDEGKIRYSQPTRKIILYDRLSIEAFLEANTKETF